MHAPLIIAIFLFQTCSSTFTCVCLDAPTGLGCGDQSTLCNSLNCDGECKNSINNNINNPLTLDFLELIEEPIEELTTNSTNATTLSPPLPPPSLSKTKSLRSLNPTLTPEQTKELWRAEALKLAKEHLIDAEADPIHHHGVRPSGTQPANIHATLIYATNNRCIQNVSECEWQEYPIMYYGGDLPMAPKEATGNGDVKFMASCIVCSDERMCTRPEFNVHMITKHVINAAKKERVQLLDVAKEIGEIEKRCKRTKAPFDQRLNHLKNQHPGLFQMFGVPPPVTSVAVEDETETGPSLEMLRSQR